MLNLQLPKKNSPNSKAKADLPKRNWIKTQEVDNSFRKYFLIKLSIAFERKRKEGWEKTKGGEGREKWEDEIYLRAEVKVVSSRGRQVGG